MKKIFISSLFALVLMVFTTVSAFALTLDNIGVTSSAGQTFSTWSYLGTNPRLMGTADPGATVTITIDGVASTTTADEDGDWAYTPTTLSASGDYDIAITSGTDSISFTLTINSGSSSASSSSSTTTTTTTTSTTSGLLSYPDTLPQSGVIDSTLFLVGGGMMLIMMGILFYWKIIPALLLVDPEEDLVE